MADEGEQTNKPLPQEWEETRQRLIEGEEIQTVLPGTDYGDLIVNLHTFDVKTQSFMGILLLPLDASEIPEESALAKLMAESTRRNTPINISIFPNEDNRYTMWLNPGESSTRPPE